MANPNITNNDPRKLEVFDPKYEEAILLFAGTDTLVQGTIMAQKIAAAGSVTADVGNTGNGTVTAFALAAGGPPEVGDWNLEVVTAVTNGGEFKLEDPDGNIIAQPLVITVGAGEATVFTVAGMTFTITDAGTDFVVGDKFALTITDSEHKWQPFDVDAVNGLQFPRGILPVEHVQDGAGSPQRRMLIEGEIYKDKLVIDAGGTVTADIIAALRAEGIIARINVASRENDNQ